jgi:hypothetical protein
MDKIIMAFEALKLGMVYHYVSCGQFGKSQIVEHLMVLSIQFMLSINPC